VLKTGDTFATLSPLLLGVLPTPALHTVTRVADGKELSYTGSTLFGLIEGKRTVSLRKSGGLFGGRTEVTVQQELSGPAAALIPGAVLERANCRLLLDLAAATEAK